MSILLLLLFKNVKIKVYKNMLLPVVLYICESRSLTLRKYVDRRVAENILSYEE
jgi:hypothetical protein